MKGVSAVIATILMLIITIALAGMAYMYISGIFIGTTQGIELVDSYCSAGVVNIKIKNTGSTDIGGGAIDITRSSPSDNPCAGLTDQADCEANYCCVWTTVCATKATLPDGCDADGGLPDSCCYLTPPDESGTATPIAPGVSMWYVDASCGSAKSCVYRITPPAGKTQIPMITCT